MSTYRRIPALVEASKFSPDEPCEGVEFNEAEGMHIICGHFMGSPVRYQVREGDWVVRTHDGNTHVVPDAAFLYLYEPTNAAHPPT